MKSLLLLFTLIISLNTFAQDADKTVTLIVSGEGKTKDEAKQVALRSAIEQAFGTFISSKTEILNDDLVKDEIVSISNGNIQEFEVISEVELPKIGYAVTLKATVSVTKLTSFVESKGYEVEFKGSLFGANIRQQKLNEESEFKAIIQLCEVSNEILSNSLDYSIEVSEPVIEQSRSKLTTELNDYQILLTVKSSPNNNFDKFEDYFKSTIESIAMSTSEIDSYKALKKVTYELTINSNEPSGEKNPLATTTKKTKHFYHRKRLYFRNIKTVIALQNLFIKSNQYLHNFEVISNIDTISVKACCYDYNINGKPIDTQNIFGRYGDWALNQDPKSNRYKTSENTNAGFPQFTLKTIRRRNASSWRVYFEYNRHIINQDIFFDKSTYYTADEKDYRAATELVNRSNGNFNQFIWLSEGYGSFPGIACYPQIGDSCDLIYIGEIILEKKDYYSKYLAIYSEEELSKITKFSVKQLK